MMVTAEQHAPVLPVLTPENNRTPRPTRGLKGKKKLFIRVGCVLFCLMAVNAVIQMLGMQQLQEMKELQGKIREVERETSQVRMEIARLESFEHIENVARNEYGMRWAGPNDRRCIAAVPSNSSAGDQKVIGETVTTPTTGNDGSLWNQISGWLGGIGQTLAKGREKPLN